METNKRYRLLKYYNTPTISIALGTIGVYDANHNWYWFNGYSFYPQEVENNLDWFEEVIETPKINTQSNDYAAGYKDGFNAKYPILQTTSTQQWYYGTEYGSSDMDMKSEIVYHPKEVPQEECGTVLRETYRHTDIKAEPIKDYEILTMKKQGVDEGLIHPYNSLTCDSAPIPCLIHSVKRLSDGEVFTVGGNINSNIFPAIIPYKIKEFEICEYGIEKDTLRICGEYPITFNMPISWVHKVKDNNPMSEPVSPILFTTEDGVDVVMYQNLFVVELPSYNIANIVKLDGIKHDDSFYFSTKESAQEYIKNHKPCLSLVDIAIGIDIDKLKQIEGKVKQRLFSNDR